jgi:hypothetical protein
VPKGFIPDPYSATVRIGARWRAGQLTTLNDQPLPNIRDGAFIELVIPAWAVVSEADRQRLQSKRVIEMLPTDARVWLGLSTKAVRPEVHEKFPNRGHGAAAGYLLAEVILLEPLSVLVDGSERAKLNDCHCGIFLLETEARSLNHAFTLLSQKFEVDRLSHTGNVFRQGFTYQGKRWLSLDALRLIRVMKALEEMSDAAASSEGT